jgi:glycosyltransferase involved in cell wall biosynthesis
MRLLQVVPLYASYNVFLRELAECASKAGHEVAVACGGMPATMPAADRCGVRLLPIDLPRGQSVSGHWRAARSLRRVIRAWNPDVLHAHFSAGMFSTALALRRTDPWISVGTFHGLSFPLSSGVKRLLVRAGEAFAAARFDRVQVLTADDREALEGAVPSARVEVQRGFGLGCEDRYIDTPRLSEDERRDRRRAIGIPDDAVLLIFVGRLVSFKGFDLAVRTYWRLRETMPEARFIVLGPVDPLHRTGLSPEEWRRYENDGGILRAGMQRDVMPWLDVADVMLFPSEREGMPVCVMEAIARGVPVLAAQVRGCRELIVNGRNGLLVSERTESGWADAVVSMMRASKGTRLREDQRSCDRFRRSAWVADAIAGYVRDASSRERVRSTLGDVRM